MASDQEKLDQAKAVFTHGQCEAFEELCNVPLDRHIIFVEGLGAAKLLYTKNKRLQLQVDTGKLYTTSIDRLTAWALAIAHTRFQDGSVVAEPSSITFPTGTESIDGIAKMLTAITGMKVGTKITPIGTIIFTVSSSSFSKSYTPNAIKLCDSPLEVAGTLAKEMKSDYNMWLTRD